MKQYKNIVQTIHKTVNTSTLITQTPTQLSKPPHALTHTLQNKLKQPQYKLHTKWNIHNKIIIRCTCIYCVL